MKKILPIVIAGAMLSLVTNSFMSCAVKGQGEGIADSDTVVTEGMEEDVDTFTIETQQSKQTSKYAEVSLSLSLPVGGEGVAQTIRENLLKYIAKSIYEDANFYGEGKASGAPYTGDQKNLTAICAFYCKAAFKVVEKDSKADYESNAEGIYDNDELTDAEKKQQLAEIPPFTLDVNIQMVSQTENYIVFSDNMSCYSRGAHGSAGGDYLIYSKKDGKQVKSILKSGVTKQMQRLLKDGLKQYMKECGEKVTSDDELMGTLLLPDDSNVIPLPQCQVTPTKDGLLFVYGQYEIAPYSMGMPAFVIPYAKVKAYMTNEALALVGTN